MKTFKKILLASIILLGALIIMPNCKMQSTVQAASIKISETKKTMYKGYTYTLKVTGTKKEVKWSSSDKSIATVNSKGKVYAKKNGKATIKANVSGKSYKCNVTVKNKPYNFIQFKNTTFYDLKDVALEYRDIWEIKNYKDFKYDFDGDGKTDKFTILTKKERVKNPIGDGYIIEKTNDFQLNGKSIIRDNYYFENPRYVYIVDLNKKDNKKYIVFFDEGPSDDPHYLIFSKTGKNLKLIKDIDGAPFYTNQNGKVLVLGEHELSPKIFTEYYTIKNSKINRNKLDFKNIKNNLFTNEDGYFTTNLKNQEKYRKLNSDKYTNEETLEYDYEQHLNDAGIRRLGKNEKFQLLSVTKTGELKIKLLNGKNGYILSPRFNCD